MTPSLKYLLMMSESCLTCAYVSDGKEYSKIYNTSLLVETQNIDTTRLHKEQFKSYLRREPRQREHR